MKQIIESDLTVEQKLFLLVCKEYTNSEGAMKCAWDEAAKRMSMSRAQFYRIRNQLTSLDVLEVEYLGRGISNFKIKGVDFK